MSSKQVPVVSHFGTGRASVEAGGRTHTVNGGQGIAVLPGGKTLTVPAGATVEIRDGVVFVNGKQAR
ncbi:MULTISPECIES: hypothetical protein [unclassified Pseudonocardia]|uniref:hypothetical protein n=1 Tax=unclassified Pseudonocardia TaxID=2619320 RepID=UPI00094AE5B7|nr:MULTISPECIES: hypothetical protein [unclassified Pseudonocardia]